VDGKHESGIAAPTKNDLTSMLQRELHYFWNSRLPE
jgi:hypothetical protein